MVRGLNVPDDPKKIRVVLTPTGGTFEPYPSETLNSNSSSFIFRIPLESECPREIKNARGLCLPLGTYDVRAEITMTGGASPPQMQIAPYDGQLRLVSGVGNEVKITAVSPFVGYPDDRNTFAFRILGQGFSREARDNVLAIDNGKEYRELGPQEIDWLPTEPITKKYDHLYGALGSSGRELVFWGIPRDYQGQGKVRVRVGDNGSESAPFILSTVSFWTPLVAAVAGLSVIAISLFALVRSGVRPYRIAGKTYKVLQAFFIDPETDTYSLSKFQFYWWTGLVVFGYVFLTVARSLVQGVVEFAPLPSGLASLFLISGGTRLLAQGATVIRGPKGAGEVQPSFADFVTAGGVVLPERVQFWVWTLLGGLGFLLLILARDPGNIQELPSLPDSFLALMGISSATYVGGKLVRKPGPIIDEILAQRGSLRLEIRGRNLSRNAGFQIDEEDIPATMLQPPTPEQRDDQTPEADLYKILVLMITNHPKETAWQQGEHQLTVINPDGQKAVWPFTVMPVAVG